MFGKLLMTFIYLFIQNTRAAVLLWSDKELRINPLQPFTTYEFNKLAKHLKISNIQIFESPAQISPAFREVVKEYYTAYTPNGYLEYDNTTYLLGDPELDIIKINEITNGRNLENILFGINIPDKERCKRDINNTTDSTDKPTKASVVDEPVIYIGEKTLNTGKMYALLYSSKPMLLKRNNSEDLHLGKVTNEEMIIYDTRLNVRIKAFEGALINIRFSFTWTGSGYWSMSTVRVLDDRKEYNLITDKDITASARFSYHCNGETLFYDSNGIELHIYDLQVQPDSNNGKFGDANDCVPFITVPIWSGLFVTAILGIGLIIALTAIVDIKTMDKFDNHKTKNLTITVSE